METAAASILQRAVDMDSKAQYTMARVLYEEGLQLLMDAIKHSKDKDKKKYFTEKAKEYMNRAEQIKKLVKEEKAAGIYREQIKIEAGSIGHGYTTVFGRFLDASITSIRIEDPYIRSFHQCQNLVRFCELVVQKCPSLTKIVLLTTRDPNDGSNQETRLDELRGSLHTRNVALEYSFSDTLHDRQVSLSNGWVIKIGRGLDYFKPSVGKCTLGIFDSELRPCLETSVDVFHTSDISSNSSE